jgi:hypothetical protein
MTRSSKVRLLGLLFLATSASAATVGQIEGRPLAGRPLEVNVPFVVDKPTDRACASANVRYGGMRVARVIVDVQGRGLNRNLLVTSPATVKEEAVTVEVRVGCGTKAATRRFTMLTNMPAARSAAMPKPATRQVVSAPAAREAHKAAAPVTPVASLPPGEPLFPPSESAAPAPESSPPKADAALMEELQKARAEAATAIAQLGAARKELAAVLDVERRTRQTLIASDHQARDAQSEVARMRLVLKSVAVALVLGAAGLVWWEFNRVAFRIRRSNAQRVQEPTILSDGEMPAGLSHA